MLGQVFSAFGGFIGNLLGGGMISTIARFAGKTLGNYVERSSYKPDEYYRNRYHLDNIYVSSNAKGKTIPLIFGKARIFGEIIWATPLEEVAVTEDNIKYFRNSRNVKSVTHETSYLYYANFALGICEGVAGIERIWINGVESLISEYSYRFYSGDEEQLPDPLIEASHGAGKVPAFRGLSYIIFEKFPLEKFGNKIPNFSFEILRTPKFRAPDSLEDNIKNMVIIPGCGEFVYDTKIQEKIVSSASPEATLYREYINCHNNQNIANSIVSVDDLLSTFPSLEWASPVVCWFADSLDAAVSNITPRVEYKDHATKTTDAWMVAGFTRENAEAISRDEDGIPNYGGTPSDTSFVRYLKELKKRNLKVMLYPMIFLDLPGKPWRGHITSDPHGIRRFFNHHLGYKNFILHYANLAKGLVDAFVIGSEFKSLTKVMEGECFPAVTELVSIAREVKAILGSSVSVTYAADWSEYHSDGQGNYNMDELWSSESIDVIGIDAYFPLTNSAISNISEEDIKRGWQSGECYDYYFDTSSKKHILHPEWAIKNIEYWWKNYHINPDGKRSKWVPGLKKIWFTEFGFPSIDKAPNQPNIFYDPKCSDGGLPRHSDGSADFEIQRKSIKATLEFWKDSEFVEKMFLWTWDARPYPVWPHGGIWRDSGAWHKGHWVNGKLSYISLSSVLLELCDRAGIVPSDIKTTGIGDDIRGIAICKQSTIWDVIALLRLSYFFDIRSNYLRNVEFIKRGSSDIVPIPMNKLVKHKGNVIKIEEISLFDVLNEVVISFSDHNNSYLPNFARFASEAQPHSEIHYIDLPISMSSNTARIISERLIDISISETKLFEFTILITHMTEVIPGNIVNLRVYNTSYTVRITDVRYEDLICHVKGVTTCHPELVLGSQDVSQDAETSSA